MAKNRLSLGKMGSKSINAVLGNDDISTKTPVNAVAATGTLTLALQPANNETITIGSVTYTFKTGATAAANQIGIGAGLAAAKAAFLAAIGGTDTFNTAHPQVTAEAFSGNNSTITAKTKGAAGNSIATTETMAGSGNAFAAATLGSGVDGTLGNNGEVVKDSSYLYVAVAKNTVSGANWRRISLGSAY